MNSKFTSKQYDFFDAINHNRGIIKGKYNNKQNLENAVNAKEVAGGLKICNTAYLTNLNDVNKINSILQKNKMSFLLNKRINIKFKIKYILFTLSPKILYRIKNILKKGVNNSVK